VRSPSFERAMLEQIARAAGMWPDHNEVQLFHAAVAERLEKGRAEYGENSFASRPFLDLLCELGEEGSDSAAWALLAAQRLQAERFDGLEGDAAAEIQEHLTRAAAAGLRAWLEIRRARYLFQTAKARQRWEREAVPTGPPPSKFYED
jgi:hypothetical protein